MLLAARPDRVAGPGPDRVAFVEALRRVPGEQRRALVLYHLADRAVALPPVDAAGARRMLSRLRVARLLAGFRGGPRANLGAVIAAITGVSAIAAELGGELAALDINPLICGRAGAVAVDVLVEPAAG